VDLMRREVGTAFDPDCFAALKALLSAAAPADSNEVPAAMLVPSLAADCGQAA
jgi:hypothetical protein